MTHNMIEITQESGLKLLQTKKTVDWLVNNTTVSVFDPINFTGYQRSIDLKHCEKIVKYMMDSSFYFPTAITCAANGHVNEDTPLRIVDGQHRVEAFKQLQKMYPQRYKTVSDMEVPVIIMVNPSEIQEIDTFITINKTTKKVDTSLAYVLKNKINQGQGGDDMTIPKSEFIAVELSQMLNSCDDPANIWYDMILFEGSPKNSRQLISLNGFMSSTRVLVNQMSRKELISLKWDSPRDIEKCTRDCYDVLVPIWNTIQRKWPNLFSSSLENRRIIQGTIGYTAFNKILVNLLAKKEYWTKDECIAEFEFYLRKCTYDESVWLPGRFFSRFTSASGHTLVARELMNDMNI